MSLAQTVGLLDIALIAAYLAAVAWLGWLGYRRTRSTSDYLLAGRRAHPVVMALSYGATFISTSAIVGFGGVAAMFGMSLLWLTALNIIVGIFIAFVFLGSRTCRLGQILDAHTFPELLGRRYQSRFIQVFAGAVIFLFMPLYAAAVIIGGTEFLTLQFGTDYGLALLVFAAITAAYVFFGGLKGVLYTDALQGAIMTCGMAVLLVATYWLAGGITAGHARLTALKTEVFAGHLAIGHRGFTAMPEFGFGSVRYNLWWIVVSTIIMGVGIGVLAQPQLIVRFMTVRSRQELKSAVGIGGVFVLLLPGVAYTVGALSNVYFHDREEIVGTIRERFDADVVTRREPGRAPATLRCTLLRIAESATGRQHVIVERLPDAGSSAGLMRQVAEVSDAGGGLVRVRPRATAYLRALVRAGTDSGGRAEYMFNPDSIIPTFISQAMPRWFGVVFLLTLLSAAMSTMSSQYHALGSAIGRDVFEQLLPPARRQSAHTVAIVRAGIVVGLVLALLIAFSARGGYVIARATSIFFGLCASAFLPAFIAALYWRRATRAGVMASMIAGVTATAFWLLLVKADEAGAIGLVRWFTPAVPGPGGTTYHPNSILWKYPNWPVVDQILIALPLSALTLVIVSMLTSPPDAAHVRACFAGENEESGPAAVRSRLASSIQAAGQPGRKDDVP